MEVVLTKKQAEFVMANMATYLTPRTKNKMAELIYLKISKAIKGGVK